MFKEAKIMKDRHRTKEQLIDELAAMFALCTLLLLGYLASITLADFLAAVYLCR